MRRLPLLMLCSVLMVACTPEAHTDTNRGTSPAVSVTLAAIQQIIVKPQSSQSTDAQGNLLPSVIQQLTQIAGVNLDYVRPMSGAAHVLRFTQPLPKAQAEQIFQQWQQQGLVEYAEADGVMHIANPNFR